MRPAPARWWMRRSIRASFFDTADVYGGQQSEVLLGQALGHRRQDVVIATKFGMAMGPGRNDKGRIAALRSSCRGGEPEAPRHRLHRSLPDSRPRPADAHRRDAGCPRRTWSGPARCATSVTRTLPAGRSPTLPGRPGTGLPAVRHCPESLQPAGARRAPRGAAGVPSFRARPAAVLSAGQRHADRQVPPRAARRRKGRAWRAWRCWPSGPDRSQLRAGRGIERVRRRARATACWSWRSAGCCPRT
jgi:hypothetical protein